MRTRILSSFLTALVMSCIMSLVMSAVNGGFQIDLMMWLRAWSMGFVIAFPCSLFLPRLISTALAKHIPAEKEAVLNGN